MKPDLTPPNDLDDEAQAIWQQALKQLKAQGTWEATDQPLLDAYARSLMRARMASSSVDDLVVPGSKGQPRSHPALDVARKCEADALALASALLLTPLRRKQNDLGTTEGKDDLDDLL